MGILRHPEERGEEGSRVCAGSEPKTDPSGGETALRMTIPVVVLSDEKDLALCHPEERSEEGSRVWFNQNQKQILRVAQDDRPFPPDPQPQEARKRDPSLRSG